MFQNMFNKYLKGSKCSAKSISAMTNISESTISRYRSGKTVPSIESGNIETIANALAELYGGKPDKDTIYEDLLVAAYEDLEMVDYDVYQRKLSMLVSELGINMSKLADGLHISVSHLSKICSGQVKPRGPIYIAEGVADYIVTHFDTLKDQNTVKHLIWGYEVENGKFPSREEYYRCLRRWILNGENEESVLVESLLHKYDEFDKNIYLPYAKEAEINYEAVLSHERGSQLFSGLDGIEDAVFKWVDVACQSHVSDEIFIFDEIFSEMVRNDVHIAYRWISALERLIKSGKKVVVVHNLENNPSLTAKEALIEIPLTLSNRIQHYYINESKNNMYRNMLLVSSAGALVGNAVNGDPDNGYYMYINAANDIKIARLRAKKILKNGVPTHEAYRSREDFANALKVMGDVEVLKVYLPVPPLSTMDEELLRKILKRNNVSANVEERAIEQYRQECEINRKMTHDISLEINIDYLGADRWGQEIVYVPIADEETGLKLTYTREEYEKHIASTRASADSLDNVILNLEDWHFFKNINLILVPGRYAALTTLVGKTTNIDTVKKPIVDAVEELMYVTAPRNAKEVQEDVGRTELLQFFRELVGRHGY